MRGRATRRVERPFMAAYATAVLPKRALARLDGRSFVALCKVGAHFRALAGKSCDWFLVRESHPSDKVHFMGDPSLTRRDHGEVVFRARLSVVPNRRLK